MPAYIQPLDQLVRHIRLLRRIHQQFPESIFITRYLEQIERMYFIRTGHILS